MDKKIIFVILVVCLLIFTGCDIIKRRIGPTEKEEGELVTPKEAEYHKGFKGVEVEFVKGQPPTNVWENTDFPITLKIQNKGAYDIDIGLLAITGNLYFIADEAQQGISFELEGKSQFNPEGEFGFEKFSATAGTVEDDTTDSFFVVACYPYKTYASATICINPRVLEIDKAPEGECEVKTISLSGGQGAPVAVTKVEEEITPMGPDVLKLSLKIYVSNKGGGKVVSTERNVYENGCRGGPIGVEDIGLINVDDIRFSGYRLGGGEYIIECPNLKGNKFRLDSSGEFIIECFANLDLLTIGSVAFTTPLLVELGYGYNQITGPQSITVKNTLE
ncbi:hypothetical protein KY345_04400 [Candidatus Woesearchaeota archaeon]|nr:hypothetical protein [Candidatus Woesearchaeota archaeon]